MRQAVRRRACPHPAGVQQAADIQRLADLGVIAQPSGGWGFSAVSPRGPAHVAARRRSTARSAALRVSDAARSNSARASGVRPSLASRSQPACGPAVAWLYLPLSCVWPAAGGYCGRLRVTGHLPVNRGTRHRGIVRGNTWCQAMS